MARLAPRDLAAEVAKHFQATIDERVRIAFALGREALEEYLAAHPEMTQDEARRQMQRDKHRGRRPSRSTGNTDG